MQSTGTYYTDPSSLLTFPIVVDANGAYFIETAPGNYVPMTYNASAPANSSPTPAYTLNASDYLTYGNDTYGNNLPTDAMIVTDLGGNGWFVQNNSAGDLQSGNGYFVVQPTISGSPDTAPATGADTYGVATGSGTGGDTYVAYDSATGTYYSKKKSRSSGADYSGSSGGGGYSSNGGDGGTATPDTYNGVPLAFPFADGFGNPAGDPTPVYANGSVHPFFGGSMPGSSGDGSGGGPARQMTVPSTGATAGPYGTSGPTTSGGSFGGGSSGGSSGGGGGGNDYYWNIRNNILGGMSGSSGSYPSDAEYRAAQNSADRAYKKDQNQMEREAQQRSMFYNLYSNPTFALPGVSQQGTPGYGSLSTMPASQLALLTSGYSGKDTFTRRPQQFENTLADLYRSIDNGSANFQYEPLMNNLFDAGKQSTLGRMFMEQKPNKTVYNNDGLYQRTNEGAWKNASASSQASTMMSMLNAIYGTTLSPKMASAYSANAQQAMDTFGQDNWDRKNPQSLLDYMGNYLGY